jgi:signal transduction histidine kinase
LLNQAGTELMFADPVRLQQILINLIGNAIKFTQQGSITISSSREHGFVELTVTDTGSGMAEEDLLVIFEKFRQLDSSSTRNRGGTGLGLAITERLVQLHGGIIRVTSTLGEGSCFSFTIPESGGNT